MPTDKQRREAERRRLRRQLQRRVQREQRRRRFALIASVVGVLVVVAIIVIVLLMGGEDSSTPPGAKKRTSSTPAASTCTWTPTSNASRKGITPPAADPPTSGAVDVVVQSNRGAMTFRLNRAAAPCAVASFTSLAQQNYFDDTPCHRLTTKGIYVLQCGDPTGTGSGGPGYRFPDELTGGEKYTRGVLAMANSGANTNGSQFFIVYKDSAALGPSYTIFGRVTKGLDVVDKVVAKGTDNSNGDGDGKPKLPITLTRVDVAQ